MPELPEQMPDIVTISVTLPAAPIFQAVILIVTGLLLARLFLRVIDMLPFI